MQAVTVKHLSRFSPGTDRGRMRRIKSCWSYRRARLLRGTHSRYSSLTSSTTTRPRKTPSILATAGAGKINSPAGTISFRDIHGFLIVPSREVRPQPFSPCDDESAQAHAGPTPALAYRLLLTQAGASDWWRHSKTIRSQRATARHFVFPAPGCGHPAMIHRTKTRGC